MTNTIQRRCSTCCTSNGEKDLFCSNCQAILGSFTLVDATRGQPISNGSLPSPQTGDKPQTPTSTLSEPPPGRQNPPLPGQDPKPSSGPTSEPLLPSSQTRKNVLRLIVFSVAALIIIFSYIVLAVNTYSINPVELTPTPTLTGPINLPHGIDVARAPNGETIGISDGRYVFDKS